MKKTVLVLLSLILILGLHAKPISIQTAKLIAQNWENQWNSPTNYLGKIINVEISNNESQNLYYTILFENQGFVIVSADDNIIPILGYSFTSNIESPVKTPAVKLFLKHLSDEIFYVIDNNIQNSDSQRRWEELIAENYNSYDSRNVNPLLQTEWDQGQYYNDDCPIDNSSSAGNNHVWAGCVATAMGQCMKYWNSPNIGTGSHSYYHPDYGTQSANFGTTNYNWNSMPNELYGPDSDVANVLYHLGVSVDMDYGPNGSGAYSGDARNALVNYFQYQNTAQLRSKDNYTNSQWESILRNELDNSRPMYYSGDDNVSGHAFVCDGYQNTNYFHFNWGWSGWNNGYFYTSNLNPGGNVFTYHQSAIIGLEPINGNPNLNPPQNLTAEISGGNIVYLDWEEPESGGTAGTLTYDSGYDGNGIGTGSAASWECSARFTSAELSDYYGSQLSEIGIVINSSDYSSVQLKVYEGGSYGNPGTLVYSQYITSQIVVEEYTNITLTNPVNLISGNEYWIGYAIDATGDHPSACDEGPMVSGKGAWMYFDNEWSLLPELAPTLDFNWCIEGIVTNSDGEQKSLSNVAIKNDVINTISNGILSVKKNDVSHYIENRSLIGYKIYRNNAPIGQLLDPNQTSFLDNNLSAGTYIYYVTALYSDGESEPSNNIQVVIEGSIMYGDVDGNGTVQAFDASMSLQSSIGMVTLTPEQEIIADVDGNGTVQAFDASLILQYSIGIITIFPVEEMERTEYIAPTANVSVIVDENNIVFSSDGNLFGFELQSDEINLKNIQSDYLQVSTDSKFALASAEPIKGEFLKIPLDKNECLLEKIKLELVVNTEESIREILVSNNENSLFVGCLGNSPNPFNPITTIKLSAVEDNTPLNIKIYNIKGKLVRDLFDGNINRGLKNIIWNGTDNQGNSIGSGIYFYQVKLDSKTSNHKMLLLK